MKIAEDEAKCVLDLLEIAWSEGLGAENDIKLCQRIHSEFSNIKLPSLVQILLERSIEEERKIEDTEDCDIKECTATDCPRYGECIFTKDRLYYQNLF